MGKKEDSLWVFSRIQFVVILLLLVFNRPSYSERAMFVQWKVVRGGEECDQVCIVSPEQLAPS